MITDYFSVYFSNRYKAILKEMKCYLSENYYNVRKNNKNQIIQSAVQNYTNHWY